MAIKNTDSSAEKYYEVSRETIRDRLERIYQTNPVGSLNSPISNSFYGINHRQVPGAIPINRDYFGYTFFTRPNMNLTTKNIRNDRIFTPLLSSVEGSIQRIIRCTLDPDLVRDGTSGIKCPLVDPQQAFIPILSNTLISMSGWPDMVAELHESEAGIYREAVSFVDSVVKDYSTYDITATFRNIPGDPVTALLFNWLHYMSNVYMGTMVPYPDNLRNYRIDSQTRIYRLTMDHTKRFVQKIAASGASFPYTCPIGNAFNYESDRPINQANDQLTITFKSIGAQYQDPILIDEFNRTVIKFNDTMADGSRERYYVKVPEQALGIFNNRGYARINPTTSELEWWVDREEYSHRLPLLAQKQGIGSVNPNEAVFRG